MSYRMNKFKVMELEMFMAVFADGTLKVAYSLEGIRSEILKKGGVL